MKKEYTIEDKLEYIKWKADDVNATVSERFNIINFLVNDVGLFGKKLNVKKFTKELNRLTADINHESNRK